MRYRIMMRVGSRWQPIGLDCYSRGEAMQEATFMVPQGAAFVVVTIKGGR